MVMNHAELRAWDNAHVWHPFTPMRAYREEHAPLIKDGDGFFLVDSDGHRYLDGNSSLWCNVHGHRVPEIDQAIRDQLSKIAHSTMLGLASEQSILLADQLMKIVPPNLKKVFYSDSGATATEVAFKLAAQYWFNIGKPEKNEFIGFTDAYHGDTVGAMSIGRMDAFHKPYFPMLFKVHFASLPLPTGEGRGEGAREGDTVLSYQGPLTLALSPRERGRADALIALIPLMIFTGHSLLFALGKLASNGELRYMLVVAPFWGLLSARGWEWIFARMSWQGVYRWAGVAAVNWHVNDWYWSDFVRRQEGDRTINQAVSAEPAPEPIPVPIVDASSLSPAGQARWREVRERFASVSARVHQALHGFHADEQRYDAEGNRASESREFPHLAGAEGEARIIRMMACVAISQHGHAQRHGMGGHVPAIGRERHGAIPVAAGDLRHHHHQREHHHPAGAALVPVMVCAQPGARTVRGSCVFLRHGGYSAPAGR